tara:strand:- start:12750 stop:13583 length:834 start_codon:yes stop_codon:yes gene_type:complete
MKFITGLLDNIKSKGRHGDTELRIVNDEVSHVNKDEAYLIDNYGLLGEVVAQSIGSGTINPSTGLREYYPGANRPIDLAGGPEAILDRSYQGADLNSLVIEGKEINFSRGELMKFIDPETNTLKDPGGLVRYIREMNPDLGRNHPSFDDSELIQWFQRVGPNFFASQEDIQDTREQFTSDARTRINKAGSDMMSMDFSQGISGVTRFGDTNRNITEGLYADMYKAGQDYSKSISELKEGDLESGAEFIYGLTDPESEYTVIGTTDEQFDQSQKGLRY